MADDTGQAPKAMTASQFRLLRACAEYWRAHRYSPSLRELVELAGLSSTSVAASNVRRLMAMGLLSQAAEICRTICLTHAGWAESGLEPPLAMSPGPTSLLVRSKASQA